jgi:hypothetical protein
MLRRLEPAARIVVNGAAIAVTLGVFSYAWLRGAALKVKDKLT